MLTKDHAITAILYEVDMSKNNIANTLKCMSCGDEKLKEKKLANQVKMSIWKSSQFWAQAQWSWTVSYPPTQKKTKDDMGSVFLAPYCRIVRKKMIHVPPFYHRGSLEFFKTGKYLSTCHVLPIPYSWWKKSCTTWHVWNPVNNGINYLSTVSSNEGCPHEPHGFCFWLVNGSSFAASFFGGQLLQSRRNTSVALGCLWYLGNGLFHPYISRL